MALKSLTSNTKKLLTIVVIAVAVIGVAWYAYSRYRANQELKHPKFYSGNGRLEATEVYVSAKLAERIEKIFIKEGDLIHKGEKLAKMNTDKLEAQRDSIKAEIKKQQAELKKAQATVKQKQIALDGAKREYERQKKLLSTNATSRHQFDSRETEFNKALAELELYEANVKSVEAEIEKQKAELEKTEADIKDSTLYAAYDGRVQDLLAHEGEVLSAGGRVMSVVALTDVYMTFFLPTNIAGKVKLGAEVKLIFDAAPEFPINAKVTFIDPVAQFTPKSVETQVEREKLMFRIKASIDPELLSKHLELVKTGIPGVAWVKLDPNAKWEECPVKIKINPPAPPAIEEDRKKAEQAAKAAHENPARNQTQPAAAAPDKAAPRK